MDISAPQTIHSIPAQMLFNSLWMKACIIFFPDLIMTLNSPAPRNTKLIWKPLCNCLMRLVTHLYYIVIYYFDNGAMTTTGGLTDGRPSQRIHILSLYLFLFVQAYPNSLHIHSYISWMHHILSYNSHNPTPPNKPPLNTQIISNNFPKQINSSPVDSVWKIIASCFHLIFYFFVIYFLILDFESDLSQISLAVIFYF